MPHIELVKRWRARDDAHAVDKNDRAASESLNALRIRLTDGSIDAADGLRLCTVIGTSLALAHASPPFVTSVVTNIAALPDAWCDEASVAVLEAYVRELREIDRLDVASKWPRGWTQLDDECAVVIADPPPDAESADLWLSQVAAEIARSGVREARVTGAAAKTLAQLLGEVGVTVRMSLVDR